MAHLMDIDHNIIRALSQLSDFNRQRAVVVSNRSVCDKLSELRGLAA